MTEPTNFEPSRVEHLGEWIVFRDDPEQRAIVTTPQGNFQVTPTSCSCGRASCEHRLTVFPEAIPAAVQGKVATTYATQVEAQVRIGEIRTHLDALAALAESLGVIAEGLTSLGVALENQPKRKEAKPKRRPRYRRF